MGLQTLISSDLIAKTWYRTGACKALLDSTEAGRLMFTWEARLNDGSIIRQFEGHTFQLLLSNPRISVPGHLKLSTDAIPRDKVVQFTLVPLALTKSHCPWFNQEGLVFSITLDPAKEELLAYWLVDHHVVGGPGVSSLTRQVIGVRDRETGNRKLKIISPSGAVAETDNDNQSYEKE